LTFLSTKERDCSMTDYIIITGQITGKARPRLNGNTGKVYTQRETKRYEDLIAWCYKTQRGEFFYDLPVKATILAEYAIPKGTPKAKREAMLAQSILPTKKPDIDNIEKIVLDALNGIAYKDDKQVVKTDCIKKYAAESRLLVKVERV